MHKSSEHIWKAQEHTRKALDATEAAILQGLDDEWLDAELLMALNYIRTSRYHLSKAITRCRALSGKPSDDINAEER